MEAILVVEDDAALRAVAEAILSSLGYRTSSVANGKAALAALDQTPEIDLLFTDLALPGGMSGIELAKLARERKPALKVLFVSGRTASSIEFVDDLKDGVGFLAVPNLPFCHSMRSVLTCSGTSNVVSPAFASCIPLTLLGTIQNRSQIGFRVPELRL